MQAVQVLTRARWEPLLADPIDNVPSKMSAKAEPKVGAEAVRGTAHSVLFQGALPKRS